MIDEKILIYGYGNIGKQDDGLGVYFAEAMEQWVHEKGIKNIFFDTNYQLNIEDSLLMVDKDIVLFADASRSGPTFTLKKLSAKKYYPALTHSMSPENLIYLCKKLYNKTPKVTLLAIKGYKWNIREGLSSHAKTNLEKALFQIKSFIQHFP